MDSNPMLARRTALIIWCALFAGVVVFAVVATAVGPGFWPQGGEVADLLAWVALGMALVVLPVSRLLPSRMKAMPGASADALAVARTIVASALNEGAGLFAGIAWMLGGRMLALVALAIALSGLLLAFPSAARWQRLGGSTVQAERPNRLVR
jgi:hypothetical protein